MFKYLLLLSRSLQAMGLSPWMPGQYSPPVLLPSSTGGLFTELAAWWWKKAAAAILNPLSPELDALWALFEAIPRVFCVNPKLWGKCSGPVVICVGLDRMWSIPWGLAPCELLLLLVAPRGLRDVKPERSTCKLVRSSKTSASVFSWCMWSGLRWVWCCFISVMECSAARGAASMFRCSRLRKLRFCWLANSSIFETGGGGVTETSDRSLDASLCCVIAIGDAVVAAGDANVASRLSRAMYWCTTRDPHCTSQSLVPHPMVQMVRSEERAPITSWLTMNWTGSGRLCTRGETGGRTR